MIVEFILLRLDEQIDCVFICFRSIKVKDTHFGDIDLFNKNKYERNLINAF